MWLGKCVRVSRFFNCKPSRSVRTLQILESVDWDTRRARGKLQQSWLLLCVPAPNNLPEVLDDLVWFLVSTVICVFLPIVNIDIGNTTNQQLQLSLVKHIHQILRNELVEPRNECVELLLDTLLDLPFRDKPAPLIRKPSVKIFVKNLLDIFSFVLVRDRNVSPIGYQVNRISFTKLFIVDGKRKFDDAFNIVFTAKISINLPEYRQKTYRVQDKLRWKSSSTPSISCSVTFFLSIIL